MLYYYLLSFSISLLDADVQSYIHLKPIQMESVVVTAMMETETACGKNEERNISR